MSRYRKLRFGVEPQGEPTASLNQPGHDLAVVELGDDITVVSSDAAWLRACAAAFSQAADLVELAQAQAGDPS